jgi:hypothetical protein
LHLIFLNPGQVKAPSTSPIGPSPRKGSGPFSPLGSAIPTLVFIPSLAIMFRMSGFVSSLHQPIHLSYQGSACFPPVHISSHPVSSAGFNSNSSRLA